MSKNRIVIAQLVTAPFKYEYTGIDCDVYGFEGDTAIYPNSASKGLDGYSVYGYANRKDILHAPEMLKAIVELLKGEN